MRDYVTGEPFLSFLGSEHIVETVTRLLDYAEKHALSPSLRLIPETTISPHRKALETKFSVEEDPDSFDYILDVASLIALDSPSLESKRRKIQKLRRDHPHITIAPLDISKPSVADNIRALCETWRTQKGRAHGEFETERLAIERCLRFAPHFQFQTLGAMSNGSLLGFTVNEIVHDGYYMGHFGKSDPHYRGLGELLESETARFLCELGCLQMNFQQDLGLLGLRRYKRSWATDVFLKKLTITAKNHHAK